MTNNSPWWKPNYKNYKDRLLQCNLLPTSYRREITDIILFLRSLNTSNGYECLNYLKFRVTGSGPATRMQRQGLTLTGPISKYSSSAQFYPCRLTKLWNSLPYRIREKLIIMDDKDKIKQVLLPYYHDRLIRVFDPESTCTWVHSCDCNRCSVK